MIEGVDKYIPLDRAITINLWAPLVQNEWDIRRTVLIDLLQREGFTNQVNAGVVIGL